MIKLINKSGRKRGIAVSHGRSVILDIGDSADITEDDIDAIEKSPTSYQWLKSGLITIEGVDDLPEIAEEGRTEDCRKRDLIAELEEKHGIKKTMRCSVSTLEYALEEARAFNDFNAGLQESETDSV